MEPNIDGIVIELSVDDDTDHYFGNIGFILLMQITCYEFNNISQKQ